MKYFINRVDEIVASGCVNYIEFCFADEKNVYALYMSDIAMHETSFAKFLSYCVSNDVIFDAGSFSKKDVSKMANEAVKFGGAVLEVIEELSAWANQHLTGNQNINVDWSLDRALEIRRSSREAYPIPPEFYEQVRAIDRSLPFEKQQEAYEALLIKHNMPSFFFQLALDDKNNEN